MILDIREISKNLFYSPTSVEYDSRPGDIYTFVPALYPDLTNELNEYSKTLMLQDNHRLLENYININFFDFPFVSMWKKNNDVTGFATGYARDLYPKNSIRILNRFYHGANSRVPFTREVLRPSFFRCIQQQLELAKKLEYDYAFFSREPRTNRHIKKLVDALNDRSNFRWQFRKGPFLMTPSYDNPKAWQSIAVTNLTDSVSDFWKNWRTI